MRASLRRRVLTIIFVALLFLLIGSANISATLPTDSSQSAPSIAGNSTSTPNADSTSSSSSSIIDYEVTTTNYGWTTTNRHSFSRRILSGEFFNATLAHPRYNASAWADLEAHPDPTRQIIAFLDIDTCIETNYPIYNGRNWKDNLERAYPEKSKSAITIVHEACKYIEQASKSPALTSNPDSRLILLDCGGLNKIQLRKICDSTGAFTNGHVIVGYVSVDKRTVRPMFDVGIPPPAIKPVTLSETERESLQSCTKKRKYLFSFQGRGGFGRDNLQKFQEEPDFYIRVFAGSDQYKNDIRTDGEDSNNYKGIMADSTFAGSPRGDLLFSYRFSEILSAGTIPVVYADGWLPPYNSHVVDWEKCAVFIPESDYDKTAEILRAIPEDKQCEMQKCVLNAWDKFVSTRVAMHSALIAVALSTTAFGIDPVGDA